MNNIHLVVPDLFLPSQVPAEASAGLALPALGKILARARQEPLSPESLEAWLCAAFGVENQAMAPVTLRVDGLEAGTFYWLRADPVHLRLQRDQLILHAEVLLRPEEAAELSTALNTHFAADGLCFLAPHPQRWYLQLDAASDISTAPLSQVVGKDVHTHLPQGADALRWHGVFNEIQMLLFEHPVNLAREARGELPINSLWLWGGGYAAEELRQSYSRVYSDCDLASAFAQVAGIPYVALSGDAMQCNPGGAGDVLVVYEALHRALQQGDLPSWRDGLQRFEQTIAAPILDLLRCGRIGQITLDALHARASRRFVLTRSGARKLWLRPKPLARYTV